MAAENVTTPISKDDLSRLVDRLDRASRAEVTHQMGRLAIYARRADTPDAHQRWRTVVEDLHQVDELLAEVIGTWRGHYTRWGAGRWPNGAGVRLGLERMARGLAAIVEQHHRGRDLRGAAPTLRVILNRLVRAWTLMKEAADEQGVREGPRQPQREPVRWGDLPAGTSADLTSAALGS